MCNVGWVAGAAAETHPPGLPDSFSLYVAVTARKSKAWGKTCRQEAIRRNSTESGEPFCTADVQLDLLSLKASLAVAPELRPAFFSQESLGNLQTSSQTSELLALGNPVEQLEARRKGLSSKQPLLSYILKTTCGYFLKYKIPVRSVQSTSHVRIRMHD